MEVNAALDQQSDVKNCRTITGVVKGRLQFNALREVLAFDFEASLMTGQAQQTAITRRLAAWAAILAVPTAIAGIYGMNFEHMPELCRYRCGGRSGPAP